MSLSVDDRTVAEAPLERRSLAGRISGIIWDKNYHSEEERKFVRKLDILLITTAMLEYFVKYLSQANVANAYASGMKEALNFKGNQYNTLLTMFTVGYVLGQFPGTLLCVRLSPSVWLPTCEVIWVALVMACAAAKNVSTLFGLRFVIGLLEASAYPSLIWLLGSWYGPQELGKRVILLQSSSSAAYMFSGYLQTAVHSGLNGRGGLAGWAWLFIMDGVICLPIAIAGYFCIPDSPDKINPRSRWYFNKRDLEIAQERIERFNRTPARGFNLADFKAIFSTWLPYAFFVPYTCEVVGLGSYAYMSLWLKATKPWNTVTLINVIPTGGYALSIVAALTMSWISDATGWRWQTVCVAAIIPLIGNAILAAWPASNHLKFAGFFLSFTATAIGAVMLTWCNELVSQSAEARAITLGFLNTGAYVINAWAPNVIFPASQAPHYKAGYKVTVAFFAVVIVGTAFIAWLNKRFPLDKLYSTHGQTADAVSEHSRDVEQEKIEANRESQLVNGLAKVATIDSRAVQP